MKDFPGRAWAYAAVVASGAIVVLARLAAEQGGIDVTGALVFGLFFLAAELAPFRMPNTTYSVSFFVAVGALVALGPAEAGIGACFAALDRDLPKRPDWLGRLFFNAAQMSLTTGLSGAAYLLAGGPVRELDASHFPGVIVPLVAASTVFFLANSGLVSVMVWLVRRLPFREVWHRNYASIVGSTFAFAVLGVFLAALYLRMGIVAVLFFLVPMIVARRALAAAADMDAAYESTLESLVTAIEAKDAYTRGHAERVSRITAMIARELGLPERRVRALRIAALMHDVGKLVVSTAILQKPGKLTEEEYEHMKAHPVLGCEIVGEIDFLREDAVDAVRHHHERLDGRGYPDNLFADEVPLTARIVMVADAFDSMTSTRTYRRALPVEAGLRELRRCAVTQFDPLVIAALDRALKRHGWEPAPEEYGGEETARPASSVHAAFAG